MALEDKIQHRELNQMIYSLLKRVSTVSIEVPRNALKELRRAKLNL
jgi:hypothetical protein